MRNDLSRACTRCAVRLPATLKRCPACGQFTTTAASALERVRRRRAKRKKKRKPAPHRLRDALLYVPAGLATLASLIGGAWAAGALLVVPTPDLNGGALVIVAVLAFLSMFAALAIIFACAWAAWALVVTLVTWVAQPASREWLLDVAPLAVPRRTGKKEIADRDTRKPARAPWSRFRQWFIARRARLAIGALLGLLGVEAIAAMLSSVPISADHSAGGLVEAVAKALLGEAVALALVLVPINFAVKAADVVFMRLEALLHAAPGRPREASIEPLRRGEAWSGRVRVVEGASVTAPISGTSCAGFRIAGRAGGVHVDDAELASIELDADEGFIAVRGRTAVLALADPESRRLRDGAARKRVAAFLAARGLSVDLDDAALGEVRLVDGEEVRIAGATSLERVGESGYRDAGMQRVIDDSDGLPVLIEPG